MSVAKSFVMEVWKSGIAKAPCAHAVRLAFVERRGLIYKRTGHLRACQLMFGPIKREGPMRYPGIKSDDALKMSELIDI